MTKTKSTILILVLVLCCAAAAYEQNVPRGARVFDVKAFGAKGDGKALDSPAVNKAIDAAAAAGGGTVVFPAGSYRCFSIRLKSNVGLYLDHGSTIVAADPRDGDGKYDPPEPNQWEQYQDFGHSHWHNSLIWGENLENVSITGPGRIWGKGLVRTGNQSRTKEQNDALANVNVDQKTAPFGYPNPRDAVEPGWGNKAISLKLIRNVLIRDISILHGGHFSILATGVDNLTIDNVTIDTNRDGIDLDGCRNVRISNTSVNAPNDDAIVLKSSFALGSARATENVTIVNSVVSGFDVGTMLDGTYGRTLTAAPDRDGPTGRIKLGTESNGAFRNITISNVVFTRSRGLALESVDGAVLEDVTVSNVTMREVSNAPMFLRLAKRLRGPAGAAVGKLRRVSISNVTVYDADPRYASIIAGVPGSPVEDVKLTNVHILYRGGLTLAQAAAQPPALVNTFFRPTDGTGPREAYAVPERETMYPEPSMFGVLPAYGFYVRHAAGVHMDGVDVAFMALDTRPEIVLDG